MASVPSHFHEPSSTDRTFSGQTDLPVELRYVVRSVEPAVVFSSLAHVCAQDFSDRCVVDIAESGHVAYRIAYHGPGLDDTETASWAEESERLVRVPFSAAGHGYRQPGYAGVITHSWRSRCANAVDTAHAEMLTRYCVRAIHEERQFDGIHSDHAIAEQLRNTVVAGLARGPAGLRPPRRTLRPMRPFLLRAVRCRGAS